MSVPRPAPLNPGPNAQIVLPVPSEQIYQGLPGRLAQLIADYVESDEASLLVQILTAFGVAVGCRPHFMVGATRHPPAVYSGLIGRTSRSRKGTGWDPIENLFIHADPQFASRLVSGIGSGEKLTHLVRDPDGDDPGAADRRLLIQESELAGLLTVVNREGNTLSHQLRRAFDGKPLQNAVKQHPAIATIHHIGLIGHCTPDEVRGSLSERQVRNGLANRIGWFLAKRERKLSRPPIFEGPDVEEAVQELRGALTPAGGFHRMDRSAAAWKIWQEWYEALPDDEVGLVAAITDRAEALVTRWSAIYALADATPVIETDHLLAAIALHEYERACVEQVWGASTGDPMCDRALEELAYGEMLQSDLAREVFSGHVSASILERIAHDLEATGRIARIRVPPARGSAGGRPALLWRRLR